MLALLAAAATCLAVCGFVAAAAAAASVPLMSLSNRVQKFHFLRAFPEILQCLAVVREELTNIQ